jgi:hypothetical protein
VAVRVGNAELATSVCAKDQFLRSDSPLPRLGVVNGRCPYSYGQCSFDIGSVEVSRG